jgi:hypothetical protein
MVTWDQNIDTERDRKVQRPSEKDRIPPTKRLKRSERPHRGESRSGSSSDDPTARSPQLVSARQSETGFASTDRGWDGYCGVTPLHPPVHSTKKGLCPDLFEHVEV